MSSDHDKLLSKFEVHLACVGRGLFCELQPRLLGTTAVSGTTTQDVNILSGTTTSADNGITIRDVNILSGSTRGTNSSVICGIDKTAPSNVLDSTDVKLLIIPDVPEASTGIPSTSQEVVIGSIRCENASSALSCK